MDQSRAFEVVKKYIEYLKNNKFNIKKAYIFGSYANGKFDDNSDIDLAIILNNISNGFILQVQLMKISRKFDTRIEPHPFDVADFDTSNPFANEIISKGIRIDTDSA